MKKFLVVVVLLAILAGVGYGGWKMMQAQQPEETPSEAAATDTAGSEATEAVDPEQPAAPAGPLVLTELGCELDVAEGWAIDEAAAEIAVVPGGQGVVLRKGDPGAPPFLVIGQVSAQVLGSKDPMRFPNSFVAELRSRFAKLQPAPKVTGSGAPKALPALLTAGQELLAEGDFPQLGLPTGSGRFVAGVSAENKVYLIAAFTAASSDDEAAVDQMIASLRPVATVEAEAAPETAPAEESPNEAATPAEAPPAKPEASPAAGGQSAAPATEPAAAPVTEPAAAPEPAAKEPAPAAKEPAPAAKEPASAAKEDEGL